MFGTYRELLIGSAITLVFAIYGPFPLAAQTTAVSVPFVGCNSDGQVGPVNAPIGKRKAVSISPDIAQHLAYYKSEYGFGVLGPRGWYCFSTYGSNGSNSFISSKPITSTELFSDSWKGFSGPAIQISSILGGTSGRFGVAAIIARVFPSYKWFVKQVMNEDISAGINPPNAYPTGPFLKDKLTHRAKNIVEYITPANSDGLGTQSRLVKNSDPISGVAILVGQTPDLVQLSVRLPKEQKDLGPIIIHQVEREASDTSNSE